MIDKDDAQITYTVRELLGTIKDDQAKGFASLEAKLASKADKADVARMEARLDHHAKEIDSLKRWQRDEEIADREAADRVSRLSSSRRGLVKTAYAIAGLIVAVVGPYLGTHL